MEPAIHALAYRHAVLAARVIVRLVDDRAASDLEMTALGCEPGIDRGVVAHGPPVRPTFAAAALACEPRRTREIFAAARELAKQLRVAATEPRRAVKAIDAIAKALPASLVAAFYDAAARGLVDAGAPASAATLVAKARAAGGDITEEALLELVLAGAVNAKTLDDYAKQLSTRVAPDVAHATFRRVCVARTRAGIPPWATMPSQLRRLAREADLDAHAADVALLEAILDAPNIDRAAIEFWRRYAEVIVELGTRSDAMKRRILDLFPRGTGDFELDEIWFPMIEATDALAVLDDPDTAAWFDRVCLHIAGPGLGRSRGHHEVGLQRFALLRRLAPRLVAGGTAIACSGWYAGSLDVDLADLALELGVRVRRPATLELEVWTQRAANARCDATPADPACKRELGRSLEHVARDPELGPMLHAAVLANDWKYYPEEANRPGFTLARELWG